MGSACFAPSWKALRGVCTHHSGGSSLSWPLQETTEATSNASCPLPSCVARVGQVPPLSPLPSPLPRPRATWKVSGAGCSPG